MKNEFGFFLPGQVYKSKDEKTGVEKMRFAGVASTTDEDTDEEILLPSGFDLSYLTENGFVNWHHRQKDKPSAIIGEPSEAKVIEGGKKMRIVCDLYNTPLAREVYELGEVLETQSKTGRRLGFSIEGKVLERDKSNPKIVKRAMITGCAITYQPKNNSTIAEIVKADGTSPDYDLTVDVDGLMEDIALLGQNAGLEILKACEFDVKKDMSGDIDNQNFDSTSSEDKDSTEEEQDEEDSVEKTLDSSTSSGQAIQPESLDKEQKDARESFLSKAELENFMLQSGIEASIEEFELFILKVKSQDMTATTTKITSEDLQKAMGVLEKAGEKKVPQPDEMEPEEEDEEEEAEEDKVEKAMNGETILAITSQTQQNAIEKAIQEIGKNYGEGFKAVSTIVKGLQDEIVELRSQLSNMPIANRKSLVRVGGSKAIEKSFDTSEGLVGSGGGNQNVLSISKDKGKIISKLESLAFPAAGGFNDAFAKAMTSFESSSQLSQLAMDALRSQGFELIQ